MSYTFYASIPNKKSAIGDLQNERAIPEPQGDPCFVQYQVEQKL